MLFRREHIEMILRGEKTQTRRLSNLFCQVGRVYKVRSDRYHATDIRILITGRYRQRLCDVTPEEIRKEGYDPRVFHISQKLVSMLENLPRIYGDRVFSTPTQPLNPHRDHFSQQRKRIAHKLKNPRLLRVTFHTFRHWKGTIEYHRTKDIVHLMQILGHKNYKNTRVYVQLEKNSSKTSKNSFQK